jgi:F0F1-type ATP synthase assembly protein I
MAGDPNKASSKDPSSEERRKQAAAYQGAMEAVFSIVIATGAGYWADDRFGTSPLYLLIGAGVGFGAFVLRVLRMRPTEEVKDETSTSRDRTDEGPPPPTAGEN